MQIDGFNICFTQKKKETTNKNSNRYKFTAIEAVYEHRLNPRRSIIIKSSKCKSGQFEKCTINKRFTTVRVLIGPSLCRNQ